MKMAVLSDIHGNLPALKSVIDDIEKKNVDEIYSLGDQVGYFPYLSEALDLLDQTGIICLQGNFEEDTIKYQYGEMENQRALLQFQYLSWIIEQKNQRDFTILPRTVQLKREGITIVMGHKKEYIECPENGLQLFGHTHEGYYYRINSQYILNPGSVGIPLVFSGFPEAHYILLEIQDCVVQVTYHTLTYETKTIWQDFIDYGCYEKNPILSRMILEMVETGCSNAIAGRYIKHAKSIMQAEGICDEFIPNEIWQRAAKDFPWALPNKFEELLH